MPTNFISSDGECHHKINVKLAARTAQKRSGSIFLDQSVKRVHDCSIVYHCFGRIQGIEMGRYSKVLHDLIKREDTHNNEDTVFSGDSHFPIKPTFQLFCCPLSNGAPGYRCLYQCNTNTKYKDLVELPSVLRSAELLKTLFPSLSGGDVISFHTKFQ